jgi:hypothetical protein
MKKLAPLLKEVEDKIGGVLRLEMFSDGTGTIDRTLIKEGIEQTRVIGVFDCEECLVDLFESLKEGEVES